MFSPKKIFVNHKSRFEDSPILSYHPLCSYCQSEKFRCQIKARLSLINMQRLSKFSTSVLKSTDRKMYFVDKSKNF